ncbi:MAG: hypothetical protein C6I01_02690 [Epsilonproteobacteria bacterium]|nr:hypothetical protein [Campylobacterota bacterium]NPA89423.1 hypothetical protein [Campylobacterota bacterium]
MVKRVAKKFLLSFFLLIPPSSSFARDIPGQGYLIAGYRGKDGILIKIDEQGQKIWSKLYGGRKDDQLTMLTPTPNGNYILIGDTISYGLGIYDVMAIKISPQGKQYWLKTYGGENYDTSTCIIPARGGGYIITGHFGDNGHGLIVRIDENGNRVWLKTYKKTLQSGDAKWIIPALDGKGYMVTGNRYYVLEDKYHPSVMEIDGNGNILWYKIYPFEGVPFKIIPATDGGYLVIGWTTSPKKDKEIMAMKISQKGKIEWLKTYGTPGDDEARSVIPTRDGGYILVGWTNYYSSYRHKDILIVKIDRWGRLMWSRLLQSRWNSGAYSITFTADGNYLLVGFAESPNPLVDNKPEPNIVAVKISPEGKTIWIRTFAKKFPAKAFAVIPAQY